ncbi:MAG: hypothetical protein AAFU85_09595 [Planctomycetota bacterium]
MRQTKLLRIAIALVTLLTVGSRTLFADEPPLSIPPVRPGALTDPASDPATEKQFERALRGERVQANTPMLQDLLDAANSIGSVLDRETAPKTTRSPNAPAVPAKPQPQMGLNGTTFPSLPQANPRADAQPNVWSRESDQGDFRVFNGPRDLGRPRDRDPVAPPSLQNSPANLAPRVYIQPPSTPQPGNQDDRFYAAEMLLRTARLLAEVSPSDPSQRQLVAAMRSQAVRLMSTPALPPVANVPPRTRHPR